MKALLEIMNLPCAGFDADGEETVNREAAAQIVERLEAQIEVMQQQIKDLLQGRREAKAITPKRKP